MCPCEYADHDPDEYQDEYADQIKYADPYYDVDTYQYQDPNINSLTDCNQNSDTANLCMGEFCKNLK